MIQVGNIVMEKLILTKFGDTLGIPECDFTALTILDATRTPNFCPQYRPKSSILIVGIMNYHIHFSLSTDVNRNAILRIKMHYNFDDLT